ncbi:MAG: transcription/translation regulatory transformer protein RfaH [Gammaproteobacteria bacterium]
MKSHDWYVVHTKPRQENVAVENLERQGFTTYCPLTVQAKRLRQRWHKVLEPLFPRYLFVKLNIETDDISPIRSTQGVVGLVRFGREVASIPEIVVDAIRDKEQEMRSENNQYPCWQKGDELEILDGPFSGLKGIFLKKESFERVLLLLDILGQESRFSVPVHYLAASR